MKSLKYWLPPILWALVIFTFSTLQTTPTSQIYWKDFLVKKTAHIVEYGIFASLLYRAFINSGENEKKAMLVSVLIAFVYGITDEFHQGFTPGREPTVRDVLIDAFGATLFIYGFIGNINKLPKKIQTLAKKYELA